MGIIVTIIIIIIFIYLYAAIFSTYEEIKEKKKISRKMEQNRLDFSTKYHVPLDTDENMIKAVISRDKKAKIIELNKHFPYITLSESLSWDDIHQIKYYLTHFSNMITWPYGGFDSYKIIGKNDLKFDGNNYYILTNGNKSIFYTLYDYRVLSLASSFRNYFGITYNLPDLLDNLEEKIEILGNKNLITREYDFQYPLNMGIEKYYEIMLDDSIFLWKQLFLILYQEYLQKQQLDKYNKTITKEIDKISNYDDIIDFILLSQKRIYAIDLGLPFESQWDDIKEKERVDFCSQNKLPPKTSWRKINIIYSNNLLSKLSKEFNIKTDISWEKIKEEEKRIFQEKNELRNLSSWDELILQGRLKEHSDGIIIKNDYTCYYDFLNSNHYDNPVYINHAIECLQSKYNTTIQPNEHQDEIKEAIDSLIENTLLRSKNFFNLASNATLLDIIQRALDDEKRSIIIQGGSLSAPIYFNLHFKSPLSSLRQNFMCLELPLNSNWDDIYNMKYEHYKNGTYNNKDYFIKILNLKTGATWENIYDSMKNIFKQKTAQNIGLSKNSDFNAIIYQMCFDNNKIKYTSEYNLPRTASWSNIYTQMVNNERKEEFYGAGNPDATWEEIYSDKYEYELGGFLHHIHRAI